MHVRVARPPSFRSHVSDASYPQRQFSLTRLDAHGLPERLVLEPARYIHDDLASWQPSLAGAVDICIAALTQPDVTADVVMPAAKVLRDVIVVAVRLVWNPLGRTEMDPARHRPPGRIVNNVHVNPVATIFHEFQQDLTGFNAPITFHVAPAHPPELGIALPDGDGRRRQRGDRRIGGRSIDGSPADPVVVASQRLRICRYTSVYLDIEHAVPPVLRHYAHRSRGRPDKRVLVNVAYGDAGDDEVTAARDELDPLDHSFGIGILPAPQVVPGGPPHIVLGQTGPGSVPRALETRQIAIVGIGDGEKRQKTPARRNHLDLEPLPDRRDDDLAADKMERVLRDGLPDCTTGWCARLEQPMRDDEAPSKQPDLKSRRSFGRQEASFFRHRLGPDEERQATQVHSSERDITRLSAKNLHAYVACSGHVYGLVARHVPIVGKATAMIPVDFSRPIFNVSPSRVFPPLATR